MKALLSVQVGGPETLVLAGSAEPRAGPRLRGGAGQGLRR